MKRIAMVLAAGLLLALGACARGKTPADPAQPETAAPAAVLLVTEQGWRGTLVQPEPIIWEERPVRPGDVITGESDVTMGEGGTLSWRLTVMEVADGSVTVRFETQGVGTEDMETTIDPPPEKHAWTAAIPYGEVYVISTLTMGAGTTWTFEFQPRRTS